MQFVVPQFIDVEDKIIGPITTRQFIMGVIAIFLIFIAYKFADLILFILEAVVVFGFYVLIAFVKVNGRPFYYFALNMIRSLKRPHTRIWNKANTVWHAVPQKAEAVKEVVAVTRRKLAAQELSSLSLLVDTGGRFRPEEILKKKIGITK